MTMTPATRLTKKVSRLLSRAGMVHFVLITAGTAGHADIVGVYRGKYVELEVKAPGDRLSPVQADMLEQVNKSGGVYAVIENPDDARRILRLIDTWISQGVRPKELSVDALRTAATRDGKAGGIPEVDL